ncbi:hypothetical protein E2C01_036778 [Portunus trituberculatus]|uniref:Uncharacterized protein n=1 Tax=Portunus trituberculatus TaxID=210409 RepID=A0A5B7F7L6_PORTR|nr:hypothetical protein [Portunus trituberculatus]
MTYIYICPRTERVNGVLWLTNTCTLTRFLIFITIKPLWCHRKFLNEKLPTKQIIIIYLKTVGALGMRTSGNTGITSNMVPERYSGGYEKGDDRALYTTKCAAV